MKKITALFICLLTSVQFVNAGQSVAVVSSQVETKKSVQKKYVHREEAFGRGIVNILTCWLEIPRNMINDNFIVMPGLGVLTGFVKAPFYTLARFGTGTIDFFTFGSFSNSLYNEERFPEYVWQADWLGERQ